MLCFTAFNITLWVVPSSTFKTNRQFSEHTNKHIELVHKNRQIQKMSTVRFQWNFG